MPTVSPRQANAYAVRATTGILGAALAAGATVFAMRNITGTKKVYITRVVVGFHATVAFTAAAQQLFVGERFSAATPTGGTAYTPAKRATTMATSMVTDARASTTAALTTTSVVFEGAQIPLLSCASPAVSTDRSLIHVFDQPIVLASGEGWAIRNVVVWPAAGTGILHGSVEWYER